MFRNDLRPSAPCIRFAAVAVYVMASLFFPLSTWAQLDETWKVTVNGQTVQVNPDGSFRIPNIAAPDQFGPNGPGSRPDFLSDDFLRVVGTSTAGGTTRYAFSEPFQIRRGQVYRIGDLIITDGPPPFPNSIQIAAVDDLMLVGESVQLMVNGTVEGGSIVDVTARNTLTIYRTSNPKVATVGPNGLVTAHSAGPVFITAVNEGATAVKRLRVTQDILTTTVEGFVQLEDGTPVDGAEVTTAFGDATTTDSSGFFSFEVEVPEEGLVSVRASATVGADRFSGSSGGLEVVPDGITDAGIIQVLAGGFELRYVAGTSNADLAETFDLAVPPAIPPSEDFEDASGGVIFSGDFISIGLNAEGSLNYSGTGIRFDPNGGGSYGGDALWRGTVREVWGVRFDSGGSSFFGFGGSNNSPNDGNVTNVSFQVYQDDSLNVAQSVTSFGPLQITTTTALRTSEKIVFIDVQFTNIGAAPIENLRYSRSADFDPNFTFSNSFDVFETAGEGTIVSAGNPSRDWFGLGILGKFTVADGLTFANANPDVFTNRDPNGSFGDRSASISFYFDPVAPGESVTLKDDPPPPAGFGTVTGTIAFVPQGTLVSVSCPGVEPMLVPTDEEGHFSAAGIPTGERVSVTCESGGDSMSGSCFVTEDGATTTVILESRSELESEESSQD